MTRNMDLVRDILLAVEALPYAQNAKASELAIPDSDVTAVKYHCALLVSAGFLVGSSYSAWDPEHSDTIVQHLTWEGHEFLDAARSNTVWKRAVERATAAGVTLSVELMKQLVTSIARGQLGI